MYLKIFNLTKTFTGKTSTFLAAAVVVMTFIDYLLKWQIYPYLFNILAPFFGVLYKFAFESFVLICLVFLTFSVWKLRKQLIISKPNALEKQILDTKVQLENQIKKNSESIVFQMKALETRLDGRLFNVERTVVDLEIEDHKKKKQVGAMAMLLKKLAMSKRQGWGEEDTLFEIKEYIKDRGMPSTYLAEFNKSLAGCSDDLKILKDDVYKLAQEKLYKVG